MPEPLLKAQSLCFLGLGPFNLELQPGERISLSGPSGSGKSQLLRALTDLIPYTGVLQVKGRPAHELPPQELRRLIGLLPAETAWWHEQVAPHFTRLQPATLAQVKLPSEAAGWPVARLSTGEKQRLALLRLLENRPQALLLDEPTSSVDSKNELEIYQNIFTKFSAKTIISSIHRLHLLGLFDLIYFFDNGKIIAAGNRDKLLQISPKFKKLWEKYQVSNNKIKT